MAMAAVLPGCVAMLFSNQKYGFPDHNTVKQIVIDDMAAKQVTEGCAWARAQLSFPARSKEELAVNNFLFNQFFATGKCAPNSRSISSHALNNPPGDHDFEWNHPDNEVYRTGGKTVQRTDLFREDFMGKNTDGTVKIDKTCEGNTHDYPDKPHLICDN